MYFRRLLRCGPCPGCYAVHVRISNEEGCVPMYRVGFMQSIVRSAHCILRYLYPLSLSLDLLCWGLRVQFVSQP